MNVQRYKDQQLSLQAPSIIKLWRERPKIFMNDMFDVTLDLWQEEVVESYITHNRVGVIANKGPGKTFLLAMLGLHFFSTHYMPKIAALSITSDHLKDNLWAEMLKWRSRSPTLEKSITDGAQKIELIGHGGYSFISARSYPKQADESQMASALAGLHADNIAFLIDEAGMIPDSVLATADAALSTGDSDRKKGRILVTGNPERPSGTLYRASLGKTVQQWKIHHVTGDPDDPKRAPKVSVEWAREQINTYGTDHPWVLINVFGRYPKTSDEQLLSEYEISESMRRDISEKHIMGAQPRLGVDVARGGADSSAMARRKGLKAYPVEMVSSEIYGPELAGKIMFMQQEHQIERVYIDGTGGFGSSVYDALSMNVAMDVISIMYNAKAQNDKLYANRRTENWVRMRDWVRKGGCLPNDPNLANELMMPKLFFHGGRFQLEAKEQIKVRLGRSPDRADALSQTFGDVECPSYFSDPTSSNDNFKGMSDAEFMEAWYRKRSGNYISDESQVDINCRSPSNYRS